MPPVKFLLGAAAFLMLVASVAPPELPSAAPIADCLLPPEFDPGVGELYFCSPQEGEKRLIEYARQSFVKGNFQEDIWINFHGVFANRLWINVGTRETNDTSLPAWETIAKLADQMRAIKAGDASALQAFLAPIEGAAVTTEEDRVLKLRLLEGLRRSVTLPTGSPLRAVLYHVHLKPTREIEEQSLMPINHYLSIPSHMDLLYAPRLGYLIPGAESKIAVAAGIWTYGLDEAQAARFVKERYDKPENVSFLLKFGYLYTRLAITEYHRRGLNDPANVTSEKVAGFITTLKPSGALLRFDFAPDWETFRKSLAQAGQGK